MTSLRDLLNQSRVLRYSSGSCTSSYAEFKPCTTNKLKYDSSSIDPAPMHAQ